MHPQILLVTLLLDDDGTVNVLRQADLVLCQRYLLNAHDFLFTILLQITSLALCFCMRPSRQSLHSLSLRQVAIVSMGRELVDV